MIETVLALWMTLVITPVELQFYDDCKETAKDPTPYYVVQGEIIVPTTVTVWQCLDEPPPPRKRTYRRRRR